MGLIFFIIALFGFGILVFIHEFGHFIMGKLFGIRVETFSIGLGPAIFGFKRGDTFYQIGAIPFGGFCKFKGDETIEDLPTNFTVNKFKEILEGIKFNPTKELLLNSYKLSISEEFSKENFEDLIVKVKNDNNKTLLNNVYEFNLQSKKYQLKSIDEENYKKIYKIINDTDVNSLSYKLKDEISKQEKKEILKAISSEMKIYNLREKDSFYGAPPYKRLLVVLFGPLMNYIAAVVFLSILALFPHKEYYEPCKIMLVDDIYLTSESKESPAKKAGLLTGDTIIKIDNKEVNTFKEIFENIYNKKSDINILLKRDNAEITKIIKPEWDPANMKYFIGIYSYLDPVIKDNINNKLQKELGLKDKDQIIGIDNNYENWSMINFQVFLEKNFSKNKKSIIHVKRGGEIIDIPIVFNEINHKVTEEEFYLNFYVPEKIIEAKNLINAFINGYYESNKIMVMSAHGLYSLIFKPKKHVEKQIGGPVFIGYVVGKITVEGFKESFYTGIRNFFEFISMISLALAFMNLLPIPALDGGYIILNIFEIIFQKSLSLKILYKIVMTSFLILISLMIVFFYFDILKLINLAG